MLYYKKYNKKKKINLKELNKNIIYYKYYKKYKYICLKKNKKLRFKYKITEKKLFKYICILIKYNKKKKNIIFKFFKICLNEIIFQLNIYTYNNIYQLIKHKHVLINDYIINIYNLPCKYKDIIIKKKKIMFLLTYNIKILYFFLLKYQYQYKGLIFINKKKKLKYFNYELLIEYYLNNFFL
uniref:Ribosomal protein S4 n=1 Tax=Lophophytum leandri TaxID=1618140 RepID=A0A8E7MIV1_9MAGN|nr:ribosomal protein S4 [Lophophytum leandri]